MPSEIPRFQWESWNDTRNRSHRRNSLGLLAQEQNRIWRNRRNITKCRDVFLRSTPSDLIHYVIHGEEFAYTRIERMYLLKLAIGRRGRKLTRKPASCQDS